MQNQNKTSLFFSAWNYDTNYSLFPDRSIYYLMVVKAAVIKFQSVREAFHHLPLVTSCVCLSFCLVIFRLLLYVRNWSCCWSVSLLYLAGNHSYSSALIFGWVDMITVLNGNGVNKNAIDIDDDFQVTISKSDIVNAPKSLKGWLSRT